MEKTRSYLLLKGLKNPEARITWTQEELLRWCLKAADAAVLFEHIDAFPLTSNFLVTHMEDDQEAGRGTYRKQGGQVLCLQEPEEGPLDHLMDEILSTLNSESAVDALWRRWSRHLVAEKHFFELLIKELETSVDIVHDPEFLAASGLDEAFWLREVDKTEGQIQWRQGYQLAYERARYALFSITPLPILQEYREQAEQQYHLHKTRYLHGLAWGYRKLVEEAQERHL